MPSGPRIRANNVYGIVADNPLTVGATTLNSTGLTVLPVVSSAHAVIVLDPKRIFGEPEIVVVTAHTVFSGSATIVRGQYGTVARAHPQNTSWAHIAINEDYITIATSATRPTNPYTGELIYETDTALYKSWNGSAWVTASSTGTSGGASTLAYSQITADQAGVSTEVAVAGLSANIVVPAGRRIKISVHGQINNDATAGIALGRIFEAGAEVGRYVIDSIAASGFLNADGSIVLTPSAGSHTYQVMLWKFSGAGTLLVDADPTFPWYILVEDITLSETPFSNASVPVGQLAYAQSIVSQTGITTNVDLTNLTVNVSVPAGRVIKITGSVGIGVSNADTTARLLIQEGATVFQRRDVRPDTLDGVSNLIELKSEAVFSPTAGSHTYKLTAERVAGTGNVQIGAGATFPAFILVEDITPTPSASPGAPGSTLGYAEVTSAQAGITGDTDLTGLAVTVTVPEGRRIRVTGHMRAFLSTVADDRVNFQVREGANALNITILPCDPVIGQVNGGGQVVWVGTPTAGTHTYKLTASSIDSGSVTTNASGTFPGFILVEDITGSVWPAGSQVTSGLVASEVWTSFVPTLVQSGSVTFTNTYSRYMRLGRTIIAEVILAVTGAGTGGVKVSVGLPINGVQDNVVCGSFHLVDASAVTNYTGVAFMEGNNTVIGIANAQAAGFGQASFTAALAAGDIVRYSVIYEAAS